MTHARIPSAELRSLPPAELVRRYQVHPRTIANRRKALDLPPPVPNHVTDADRVRDYLRQHGPSTGQAMGRALARAAHDAAGVWVVRYESTGHGITALFALGDLPNAARPRGKLRNRRPKALTSHLQGLWVSACTDS